MVERTWVKGQWPEAPVRQVYGVVFSEDGLVLLQEQHGTFNISGGKPEPRDGDFAATLAREFREEMNAEVGDARYLGYLLVEQGGERYAQVRMVARLRSIGPARPDPDNGRLYGRFLARPERVRDYLRYADAPGNAMLRDAVAMGEKEYSFAPQGEERWI